MSEYVLKEFPDPSALQFDYQSQAGDLELNVNSHLHTPYSYSYFDSIREIFRQALEENVRVLGINDFFMADGFPSFYEEALKNRIFPNMIDLELV